MGPSTTTSPRPETHPETCPEPGAGWPELFSVDPGYLNAATMGVPPLAVSAALREALAEWATGHACPVRYDESVGRAREHYAALVGVHPDRVAVGSQVSTFAGTVAASLPDGAEVVCVDGDFSSMVFPFLVQADRGIRVRHVPLARLADAVAEGTTLVAFSLVQSACGSVADLDAVVEAAARVGARTFVDVTQAVGWLPFDASRVDYSVCAGYKWLCNPRGTAFLTVRRPLLESLRPINAGWYAGEQVWSSVYGPAMDLASSARRHDVSPAWLSWVGAEKALEVFRSVGIDAIHAHDVALANKLRAGLGVPAGTSAVVALRPPIVPGDAQERLAAAGVRVSARAGNLRMAFHLWNAADDVELALLALS